MLNSLMNDLLLISRVSVAKLAIVKRVQFAVVRLL